MYPSADYTLVYSYLSSPSWTWEVIDSVGSSGSEYPSLAINSSQESRIAYGSNNDFKLAKWISSSATWEIELLGHNVGYYVSMAINSKDEPCIAYSGVGCTSLNYARWDSKAATWEYEAIDKNIDVAWNVSLALDSNDKPHITYCDDHKLKYAYRK